MGCDIHIYLEQERTINNDKKWVSMDYYKKNPYYDKNDEEDSWQVEYDVVEIYNGRNYSLFSILAGVRNYGENSPIVEPRGIPFDCCKEIRELYEKWGSDAHTPTYLTYGELKEYSKNKQMVKYSGMISKEQSDNLDKGILPTEWCQWTNMDGYITREWEMEVSLVDPIIETIEKRICDECYIYSRSQEEKEEKLKEYYDKVRTVFWFDN